MEFDNLLLNNNIKSKNYYKEVIEKTSQAIINSFNSSLAYKGLTPEELKKDIDQYNLLPEDGESFEVVLDRITKKIIPNFLYTSSKNYMAHLHSPALIESIASELIIATYNQSMDSWDQSPVATEVEVLVIDMLTKLYNLSEDSDGVFTSGGSQSNFSGLLCARDWYCNTILNHDIKKKGLPSNYNKFRIYTSEVSHFSVEKSAHILGLGYDAVRKVPVDENFKMDISALKSMIEEDLKNDNIPIAAVATIGTTDFGSIDDVKSIRSICDQYSMYLHSDAAYGGALILSDNFKNRIDGIELSNSITIDFHKMFLLPISCSAFLVNDKSLLDPFKLHADYLNREEDEIEGYTNLVNKSMQTTRRFDALKVWIAFQTQGKKGYAAIIDKCVNNATNLYNSINLEDNFETLIPPELSSVVFKHKGSDRLNKKIRKILLHENGLVIGQTSVNGKVYLKCTLLNPTVTIYELRHLIKKMDEIVKDEFKKLKG
ncbi:MAG: pyridoxal phosphate-dependent decarboxylase family protein [Pleomorphochaeta sp.]